MMRQNKVATLLALSLSLHLVGSYAHGNLRGTKRQSLIDEEFPRPRRRLQRLFTALINSLVSVATPTISEKLTYVAREHYNSYDFAWLPSPQYLGEDAFLKKSTGARYQVLPSICDASAGDVPSFVQYDYSVFLTHLEGIGGISIDRIAFVQSSQRINLDIGVFRNGAHWSGQWLVDTSFENMTASTMTTVTATVTDPNCGAKEEQQMVVNGTVFLENIVGSALATVRGETGRLASFLSTSLLDSMQIDSLTLQYDPIDTSTMGSFDLGELNEANSNYTVDGEISISRTRTVEIPRTNAAAAAALRNLPDLSAVAPWGDAVEDYLNEYGKRLFKYTVEDELNYLLPRPFIRPDDYTMPPGNNRQLI